MAQKKTVKQSKAKLAFRQDQSKSIHPLITLDKLRSNVSISEYKDCINHFIFYGKFSATTLFRLGQSNPNHLVDIR